MRRALASTFLLAVVLVAGASAQARPWSRPAVGGDDPHLAPQPARLDYALLEVQILGEINAMRRDPAAYAEKMRATRALYRGNLIMRAARVAVQTQEGVAALDEAVQAVGGAQRLTRLAHAEGLKQAARDHARDLGQANRLGHNGSDGSTPDRRIARHGTWDVSVAENIAFGPSTAEDVVMGLLIDDGVADRGHREVLLSNDLFFAGVGCGPHPGYRVVCVVDFATAFRSNHLPGPPRRGARQAAEPAPTPEPEPAPDTPSDPWDAVPEEPFAPEQFLDDPSGE